MGNVKRRGSIGFSELMRTGRVAYTEATITKEDEDGETFIETRIPHIPHDEFLDSFGHVMGMAVQFGESPRWIPTLPGGESFPVGVLQVILFLMTHHTDDIKKIVKDHPEISARVGKSHFLPDMGQCLED